MEVSEFVDKPYCCLCSSKMSIDELLDNAAAATDKKNLIELFDYKEEVVKRLLPAYVNAVVRSDGETMRSGSIGKEMLQLVSGEKNISDAIERYGINDAGEFLVFATSRGSLEHFLTRSRAKVIKRYDLQLDYKISEQMAAKPSGNY